MYSLKCFSLALLLFSLTASAQWVKVKTEDNITVYKKKNHKGKIIPIKSEAIINSPFNIVLSVLADVKRKKEWAPNYITSKTLEKIDDFNRIEYNVTDVPWPFYDRDFVFKVSTKIDKETKTITVDLKSINNYYPLQDDYVRGEIKTGKLIVKVIDKEKSHLTMIVETDPAGNIPKWLANYASKLFPYRFLHNLTLQAEKLKKEKEYYLKDYNPF